MASTRNADGEPSTIGGGAHPSPRDSVSAGDGGEALADAVSANAVYSAGSGVTLVAGAPILSGWVGADAWALAGIGGGLVVFAGVLVWLLAEPRRLAAGAGWVVAADLAWAGGAIAVLTLAPGVLSTTGRVALAAVTIGVGWIVIAQLIGLRRRGSGSLQATSTLVLRVERVIAAPSGRVWEVVSDAGGYARFAPGIAATRIVAGDGEGMVRVCQDGRGGQWAETCTLWEPGYRYRMTVDVDSYPAYYRLLLADFALTWVLEPVTDGTHLGLQFDGRVKLGVIGRIIARVLGNSRRLEAILDNVERELTESASSEVRKRPA